MNKVLSIVFLFLYFTVSGQNKDILSPQLLDKDHYFYKMNNGMNYYLYLNKDTIHFCSSLKAKYYYLYKNQLKVDSLTRELSFDNPIRFIDKKAWFILPRESAIYQLDENCHFKEIFSKDSLVIYDLYNDYFLVGEYPDYTTKDQVLYSINSTTGDFNKMIDLRGQLSKKSNTQDAFLLRKKNKILIYTGYIDDDVILDERYFLFSLDTKSIEEVTNQMKKLDMLYDRDKRLADEWEDGFQSTMFNNQLKDYLCTWYKVLDEDFNIITPIVIRYVEVAGYNYKNNQFESFNLRTWLDNESNAIIPYRFDVNFEKALYKIYTNELLIENEIKQLDPYFYPLIKNFIYAKYNYGFENEYYQAFYNLFGFYQKGRAERKKRVDKYFTDSDKANLKLILEKIK